VSGEASMFVQIDEHTVSFLPQGGWDLDRARLADHGVHGNETAAAEAVR
jgi:hypothetical protein